MSRIWSVDDLFVTVLQQPMSILCELVYKPRGGRFPRNTSRSSLIPCHDIRGSDCSTREARRRLIGCRAGAHLPSFRVTSHASRNRQLFEEPLLALFLDSARTSPDGGFSLLPLNSPMLICARRSSSSLRPGRKDSTEMWYCRLSKFLEYSVSLPPDRAVWNNPLSAKFVRKGGDHSPPTKDKPGSYPCGVIPIFLHVGIVRDDATGRWVFSGVSRLTLPRIPALLYTNLTSPSSVLKTPMFRAANMSPLHAKKPKLHQLHHDPDADLAGCLLLKGCHKAWICIFTCAVCSGRFIARTGKPRIIYSVSGSNLEGTENAFRNLY
ncbi:hypothetical protein PR048_032131 [Dryococelus australis]|uniref:Uncharacterized protein n=1 Tax=Dryococelus australis TaxID=614101 RepID=A0ABQ9G1C4_9NEOP|nr:hypothetical protein PR048_032131 [Dryococelus australis]